MYTDSKGRTFADTPSDVISSNQRFGGSGALPVTIASKNDYNSFIAANPQALDGMSIQQLQALYSQLASINRMGNLNDELQDISMRLEYAIGEQNYQRSTPAAQLAQMRALGMSRSAALASAQQAQPDTAVSPFQAVNTDAEKVQNVAQAVASSASVAFGVAQLPFSIASKVATTKILQHQGAMLQEQENGLFAAAAFEEACSIAIDEGALSPDASISDKLAFFRKQMNLTEGQDGYHFASNIFGNSMQFMNALSNPFFYSAVKNAERETNAADASVYDVPLASSLVASRDAAVQLTQNQTRSLEYQIKALAREDLRAELLEQLRIERDQLALQLDTAEMSFDLQRVDNFIKHIEDFKLADFMEIDAKIKELSYITDPQIYNQHLQNLREDEKVLAGTLIYQKFLADAMVTGIDQITQDQSKTADVVQAAQDQIIYRDLYGGKFFDRVMQSIDAGAGIISAFGSLFSGLRGGVLPAKSIIESTSSSKSNVESVTHGINESTVRMHRTSRNENHNYHYRGN